MRVRADLALLPGDVASQYDAVIALVKMDWFPDRTALAAHAARELMDVVVTQRVSKDAYVDPAIGASKFRALMTKTGDLIPLGSRITPEGTLDPELQGFLNELESEYTAWKEHLAGVEKNIPRLVQNRPGADPASKDEVDQIKARWLRLRKRLASIAHHSKASSAELADALREVTLLLASVLKPKAVGDIVALDQLLEEGES